MDFSTGNSGNQLREAVIKIGSECQQEGAYAQLLGPDVCPEVYAIIPNGYVMEKLEPLEYKDSELLIGLAQKLEKYIWNRPALPSSLDSDWRDNLKKYGIETPDWVMPDEYCMVHGDPTVSNVLVRRTGKVFHTLSELIFADPRPPRDYIPQCRETDLGRLLQSKMGWEVVAYSAKPVPYVEPLWRSQLERQRAIFWCGAAAARIEYFEKSRDDKPRYRPHILEWCRSIRKVCNV